MSDVAFENTVAKTLTAVHIVADETDVLKAAAQTSGALGYLASGFLGDRGDLVVTYQGVAPTPETIHSNGYGFSTNEHLYTQKNPHLRSQLNLPNHFTDSLQYQGGFTQGASS